MYRPLLGISWDVNPPRRIKRRSIKKSSDDKSAFKLKYVDDKINETMTMPKNVLIVYAVALLMQMFSSCALTGRGRSEKIKFISCEVPAPKQLEAPRFYPTDDPEYARLLTSDVKEWIIWSEQTYDIALKAHRRCNHK